MSPVKCVGCAKKAMRPTAAYRIVFATVDQVITAVIAFGSFNPIKIGIILKWQVKLKLMIAMAFRAPTAEEGPWVQYWPLMVAVASSRLSARQ